MKTVICVLFLFHRDRKPFPFIQNVGERQSSLDQCLPILSDQALGLSRDRGRQLGKTKEGGSCCRNSSVCFLHFQNLVPLAVSLMLVCLSPWGYSHNFISRNRDGVHGRKFSMDTMDKTHKERHSHCSPGLHLRVLGSSKDSMHFVAKPLYFIMGLH